MVNSIRDVMSPYLTTSVKTASTTMVEQQPRGHGTAKLHHRLLLPVLASAAASIITGTALVATRFVVTQIDGLTTATLRYVVAAACLVPLVPIFYRFAVAWRDMATIAGLGILYFCLFPWSISAAMQHTTASGGSVVLACTPAVTLFLACITGGEVWSLRKALGGALALMGAAIAILGDDTSFNTSIGFGDFLMVLATLMGAIYAVFSKPQLAKYSPLTVTTIAMAAGASSLLILSAIRYVSTPGSGLPHLDSAGWCAILYIGIMGGALSFFLYAWALERTTPTVTMIFMTLNPIAAIFAGVTFLGEPLGVELFVGLAFVILGIVLVVNYERSLEPNQVTGGGAP
jgi:drug/metabolite transporter (DMT)-like permease